MPVYVIATLDTKGREAAFVRDRLKAAGIETRLVDAGSHRPPAVPADVSREAVFAAAGTTAAAVLERADRGEAVNAAARGAAALARQWHADGLVEGILGLGGSAGTTIGTSAMRALPLGVPKLMVSTLASGQVRQYVGDKDILMLNSIVDILGINRISRLILGEAAAAMAGMVAANRKHPDAGQTDRPLIAASMFGVTTPCVEAAKEYLENRGYELLVFHATGNGGQAMESLIRDGLIAGVLDVTTTELADELVGGILSAGPDRLTAAGQAGVPQVISVGAIDMVNFGPRASVPEKFADRKFHVHNANVTLMRTTVDENRQLGEIIGRKAAAARGPTAIFLPLQGLSAIDAPGKPFEDAAARDALYTAIRAHCGPVECRSVDAHINDPAFAQLLAQRLVDMIQAAAPRPQESPRG